MLSMKKFSQNHTREPNRSQNKNRQTKASPEKRGIESAEQSGAWRKGKEEGWGECFSVPHEQSYIITPMFIDYRLPISDLYGEL